MKTIVTAILLGVAVVTGGCAGSIPLPPLWMLLLQNDTTPAGTPNPMQPLPAEPVSPTPAPAAAPSAPDSPPALV